MLCSCDKLEGFEKELSLSKEWPQKLEGSFYLLDSDQGDGVHASWAIGTFEPAGIEESILIEFRGSTLKDARIGLDFKYENPVTIWVNQQVKMYFQVVKIEDSNKI